ncbi:unnamed protein product [Paramecium sonneborni]|uniref:Uncharacterized protein n=1 Tax=Paramecium sonneborni TaxID=65129 RepID=A0A8S1RG55_9CILI|nr:unnamed protein product [Paramecium sonneborni]
MSNFLGNLIGSLWEDNNQNKLLDFSQQIKNEISDFEQHLITAVDQLIRLDKFIISFFFIIGALNLIILGILIFMLIRNKRIEEDQNKTNRYSQIQGQTIE